MDLQQAMQLGYRVLSSPNGRAGMRAAFRAIPPSTLANFGLSRLTKTIVGVPLVSAFAIGAAAGAAAIMFLAPGGDRVRENLVSKLEGWPFLGLVSNRLSERSTRSEREEDEKGSDLKTRGHGGSRAKEARGSAERTRPKKRAERS